MANSKYAYVRDFELPDPLLPGTFVLFRLDGRGFHRFSDKHGFEKPSDVRALQLMDRAATDLMEEHADIVLAFGESDEFSFLLRKATTLYNRRQSKIVSILASYFTSSYVFHWSKYFPDTPLQYPPCFDGRIVLYPTVKEVRDYFAWRQADAHINNLYNTTFWALVHQGGQTTTQAHATLRGTFAKDKHEILFSRFSINYNNIDARLRKGSVLCREEVLPDSETDHTTHCPPKETAEKTIDGDTQQIEDTSLHIVLADEWTSEGRLGQTPSDDMKQVKSRKGKQRQRPLKMAIKIHHCDIIKDEFWSQQCRILEEE